MSDKILNFDNKIQEFIKFITPHEAAFSFDNESSYANSCNKIDFRIRPYITSQFLYAEVMQGGFYQYYSSSYGIMAPEAACDFVALDRADIAEIIDETLRFFRGKFPRNHRERAEILDKFHFKKDETYFSDSDAAFLNAISKEIDGLRQDTFHEELVKLFYIKNAKEFGQ
ncbi:MAG: DMP19 family protein [Beijerinckiaceae bacterium]